MRGRCLPISPKRVLACLALAVAVSGCSAVALKRAPGNYKSGDAIDCTDTLTYPLIDMTATVLTGLLAVSLISVDREDGETPTAGIVMGTLSLAAGVSAVWGTYQVGRCKSLSASEAIESGQPAPNSGNERAAGSQGGPCLDDGSCGEDLKCDAPMQVCVPDDPSEF